MSRTENMFVINIEKRAARSSPLLGAVAMATIPLNLSSKTEYMRRKRDSQRTLWRIAARAAAACARSREFSMESPRSDVDRVRQSHMADRMAMVSRFYAQKFRSFSTMKSDGFHPLRIFPNDYRPQRTYTRCRAAANINCRVDLGHFWGFSGAFLGL